MPPTDPSQNVPDPEPEAYPDRLTGDQIDRLAEMLADDRCAFPDHVTPADRERLLESVRSLHRTHLVQLIARAIAQQHRRGVGLSLGDP